MGDLTITPAEVQPGAAARRNTGILGATLVAGESVYVKAADSKLYKAVATTEAEALAVGIMVCGGDAGQVGVYQADGPLTLGASASVAQGQTYVVSANAGKIALESDPGAGKYMTILGVGNASDGIDMKINATGIDHG